MIINTEGADQYFDLVNHVDAAAWSAFTPTQQTAAVATAARQLSRALRRNLGTGKHDDFAVYEQAFYLLKTHAIADGSASMPYPSAQDAEVAQGAAAFAEPAKPFADEALRWLGWNGVSTVRG